MQIEAQQRRTTSIAVFGGSFNPPHLGHMGIVRALSADPAFDEVWVLPARRSPFKPEREQLPDDLRWAMLRRLFAGLQGVVLSDLELRQPPPSYTYETLVRMRSLLPHAVLHLIMGWDAFADFQRWYRAAEILRLAGLVVFDRAGTQSPPDDPAAWISLLPEPFREGARGENGKTILAANGRLLVRRLDVPLPQVAGRDILRTRRLDDVPEEARELLEGYWSRADTGPRPPGKG